MSKVKTTIYLVLFLALVNIATSIQLRAQTLQTIRNIETYAFANNNDAQKKCPKVCARVGLTFTGQWANKKRIRTDYAVCSCK